MVVTCWPTFLNAVRQGTVPDLQQTQKLSGGLGGGTLGALRRPGIFPSLVGEQNLL